MDLREPVLPSIHVGCGVRLTGHLPSPLYLTCMRLHPPLSTALLTGVSSLGGL